MVKADDIKTGELSTTNTTTYILNRLCTWTRTKYKQIDGVIMVWTNSERSSLVMTKIHENEKRNITNQ